MEDLFVSTKRINLEWVTIVHYHKIKGRPKVEKGFVVQTDWDIHYDLAYLRAWCKLKSGDFVIIKKEIYVYPEGRLATRDEVAKVLALIIWRNVQQSLLAKGIPPGL